MQYEAQERVDERKSWECLFRLPKACNRFLLTGLAREVKHFCPFSEGLKPTEHYCFFKKKLEINFEVARNISQKQLFRSKVHENGFFCIQKFRFCEIYLFSSALFYMQSSCYPVWTNFSKACAAMSSSCGTKLMDFFCAGSHSKMRIIHTRLLALVILALLLLTRNISEGAIRAGLLDFAGLVCVIVSAFGRVWSSVYIAGYKTSALIEAGPYSVTRNPLYFFSLIGTIGVGLACGSIVILVLLLICFGIYYPFVIRREEQDLGVLHGPEFLSYMQRVPRFFPKLSLYSEPETYTVKPKLLKRALLDASYFVWVFGLVQLIEKLREAGIFPTLFRIP